MKNLMLILVFAVASLSVASPLSVLFGTDLDSTMTMEMHFSQYTPTVSCKVVDSLSPTCYSGSLHDTAWWQFKIAWGRSWWPVEFNGWTLMAWVRFDERITSTSESKNIPLIKDHYGNFSISKNGSQILFQIIKGWSDSINPDTVYPYSFKSDSFPCVFDGYFHLFALSYNGNTGMYSSYVDGNKISTKPAAAGVDTVKTMKGSDGLIGFYFWTPSPNLHYNVPAGSYFAGATARCRILSDAVHKRYYDTTIAHAPVQPSAVEKTSLAIVKTHLLTVSPNPINNNTTINFYSAANEKASMRLYNANGSLIRTLFYGNATGQTFLRLSCNNLATGIYVMELETKNHRETTKISILK